MAACGALHLGSLAVSPPTSGALALVMLAMALACVPCATRTVLAPTRRTWVHSAAVSVGMLVAHPLLGLLDGRHAMHVHGTAPAAVTFGLVAGPLLSLCLSGYGIWVTGENRRSGDVPEQNFERP